MDISLAHLEITKENGDWYCSNCTDLIDGQQVSYYEVHTKTGCEVQVIWKPQLFWYDKVEPEPCSPIWKDSPIKINDKVYRGEEWYGYLNFANIPVSVTKSQWEKYDNPPFIIEEWESAETMPISLASKVYTVVMICVEQNIIKSAPIEFPVVESIKDNKVWLWKYKLKVEG